MRKQLSETEEVVDITASPVVIAISMEAISTVLRPIAMATSDSETVYKKRMGLFVCLLLLLLLFVC